MAAIWLALLLLANAIAGFDGVAKLRRSLEQGGGQGQGHHPLGVGHHPPGVGHHPPGVCHRFPGHHPGVGHHPPGVGHHRPECSSSARALVALQAWKRLISRDPLNITGSWVGSEVCNYKGVFCGPSIHDSSIRVVSGIDLNHANLEGQLPSELGQMTELGIFHINSNAFTGVLPESLKNLVLLGELDVSNNKLSGVFPAVTLQLPSLIYLDIRFNKFYGSIPAEVFQKKLDALFVNDNNFEDSIPGNFGNSPVSVAVFANNHFTGEIPSSIGNMSTTLNELILLNNALTGSLPSEIGLLNQATVFDVGSNKLTGTLPRSFSSLVSLVELNVGNNMLSGNLTASVCELPSIKNLTASDNFFTGESASCRNRPDVTISTSGNCISRQGRQKSGKQCREFYSRRPPESPPPMSPPPVPTFSPRPGPTFSPPPPPFSPPPPMPTLCPMNYTKGQHSGRCFQLVTRQKSWSDAKDFCADNGGELAAVADLSELEDLGNLCSQAPPNQALIDPYSPRGQGCYLGGEKIGNNLWRWSGSRCVGFNSSFWNFLEPNDLYGRENCTSIKYEPPILRASTASLPYMLNDLFCAYELPFVCSTRRC